MIPVASATVESRASADFSVVADATTIMTIVPWVETHGYIQTTANAVKTMRE